MSCQNCVRHAEEALRAVQGVDHVTVNLEKEEGIVSGENLVLESLISALEEEGYSAAIK